MKIVTKKDKKKQQKNKKMVPGHWSAG